MIKPLRLTVLMVLCLLNVSAKEVLKTSDEKIEIFNFGKGILTYKFKTPRFDAIQEWKESAISGDLIDLNLISIPDIVIDPINNITSYPFFDIARLSYEIMFDAYNISQINSEREIWTYSGYKLINDNLEYKQVEDFEFKILPQIRPPFGNYERSSQDGAIILPKISIRVARKVFPEKYSTTIVPDNLEAENFWHEVFNSSVPIVLTEGHKKALSLLSHGIVALSVSQDCMGLKTEYIENELILTIARDLRKIFKYKPRTFYISFDHDSTPYIRNLAYSSMLFIAKEAELLGNKAKIISLPDHTLKGADDYIYSKGFEEFKKLYDNAYDIDKFSEQYSFKLEEIFQEYKINKTSYAWCFESCKGKCLEDIAKKNK